MSSTVAPALLRVEAGRGPGRGLAARRQSRCPVAPAVPAGSKASCPPRKCAPVLLLGAMPTPATCLSKAAPPTQSQGLWRFHVRCRHPRTGAVRGSPCPPPFRRLHFHLSIPGHRGRWGCRGTTASGCSHQTAPGDRAATTPGALADRPAVLCCRGFPAFQGQVLW